jgi:hypothetical protein
MALAIVHEFNNKFEKKHPEYAKYAQSEQPRKTGANWLSDHYRSAEAVINNAKSLSLSEPTDFSVIFEKMTSAATDGQANTDKRIDGPAVQTEHQYQNGPRTIFK